MKDKNLRQLDESSQAAGDLGQVQALGVSEDQLQELLHVVEGVVRQWMSGSQTSSKISRRSSRSCDPGRPCGSRRTTLPEDFALDFALIEYARDHLPEVNVVALFEGFSLQARAKQWKYADWPRAFQVYVRNAAPNSGHWSQGQYPKLSQSIDWTQPVDPNKIKW